MRFFLGIDIGTSGTRAIVIDSHGKLRGAGTGDHSCQSPLPLWSEQSPQEWWNAVVAAVPTAIKAAGVKPEDIKGVGLSGQMHGLVLLDKNNAVLRPAILWNDQRTAAECAEITKRAGGPEALLKMVSNPALTGFTAPKMLWVRRHEPQESTRARSRHSSPRITSVSNLPANSRPKFPMLPGPSCLTSTSALGRKNF